MQEEIRQVSARIRELRELAGMDAGKLAAECGVDAKDYAAYESGEADIPVGLLHKLARRFNVELSTLITGAEPRLHTYCLTRRDKGVSVERRKDYKYASLAYNFAHKKAEPFLVTVEPDEPGAPVSYNSHPGQEFDYVLAGTLRIMLDGHELILEEGDSLFFDAGVRHGMKALHGRPARFLAVIL
ncbi:MAG: helix-turn-helix domain-containing protein [Patescibacteria group bacterium]